MVGATCREFSTRSEKAADGKRWIRGRQGSTKQRSRSERCDPGAANSAAQHRADTHPQLTAEDNAQMNAPQQNTTEDHLDQMLRRSDELHETLLRLHDGTEFDLSPRGESSFGMCSVALEHASSLRVLMAMGLPTSAVGLMRLQFEALTRAMWLLYGANDAAIAKLVAPLTTESEQAAKNLPSASEMIEQIGKRVGTNVPEAAHQMLVRFKEVSWQAMNSFVHGGIHPLRRHAEGFPVPLALQIMRNSNGLSTMTGMVLAVLTGDEAVAKSMSRIQPEFADCLPELLK